MLTCGSQMPTPRETDVYVSVIKDRVHRRSTTTKDIQILQKIAFTQKRQRLQNNVSETPHVSFGHIQFELEKDLSAVVSSLKREVIEQLRNGRIVLQTATMTLGASKAIITEMMGSWSEITPSVGCRVGISKRKAASMIACNS